MLSSSFGMTEIGTDSWSGKIVSITSDTIFIDLGLKAEAQLDRREAQDDKGELSVVVGDEMEAAVVSTRGDVVLLSLGALKAHQLSEMLATAAESGIPVEGKVTGFNDGGLEVGVGTRRAFCPKSRLIAAGSTTSRSMWGRPLSFWYKVNQLAARCHFAPYAAGQAGRGDGRRDNGQASA